MAEEKIILRAGIKLFGFYYFMKGTISLLGFVPFLYAGGEIASRAQAKNIIFTVTFPILFLILGIVLMKKSDFAVKVFFKS